MTSNKRIYLFTEGAATMKDLLGGKGANLAEMTRIGLPVPPGFTITTEVCNEFSQGDDKLPEGLMDEVKESLALIEKQMGKKLGDPRNPLLVSVRSGAKFSMPGMMDTILNLGLNDESVKGLDAQTGNKRFAYDSYRRFVMMFSDIVLDVPKAKFEHEFSRLKERLGVRLDTEVGAEELKELVEAFKRLSQAESGRPFPADPMEQLQLAIEAVFRSWNNPRAVTYRKKEQIPDSLGTAVNVQAMVFGNMGDDSGTGVAFTRDPRSGEEGVWAEFLPNAQGEDVVAGVRTPLGIEDLRKFSPRIYGEFIEIAERLEKHYREMQDLEFTIERCKLYILQCRAGKRTPAAAVRIAVDMGNEGLIGKEEAVLRVEPEQLEHLLHKQVDPRAEYEVLAKGLPASPGAASGKAVFDPDRAAEMGARGEKVVLVRPETNPDDIHGLLAAQGVLTARGGMTSHAALVARQYGVPCVAGCEAIVVDEAARRFEAKGTAVSEGDVITIDGTTGAVVVGELPMVEPQITGAVGELLSWADQFARLGVRTNADKPNDAQKAYDYGARGIGLCRTEHMFFAPERLPIVQKMILAEDDQTRQEALDRLLPMQKADFVEIFRAMHGCPVTVRLIDPPLHEFLPDMQELLEETARLRVESPGSKELKEKEGLLDHVRAMHEQNPMLGLRGCRLSIVFPQIVEMQTRAIIGAAAELAKNGEAVAPEIMIPLVGHVNELKFIRDRLEPVAQEVIREAGVELEYKFGTMIEVPRAALTADEIAACAEFFSFGTNDLTQMTFAFSRDDAEGKFIGEYLKHGILPANPFQTIDIDGVGKLMRLCVESARKAKPDLKIGICGEHGGDPKSIKICHDLGLDYVSCSPPRVPVARLAAAHANIATAIEKDK